MGFEFVSQSVERRQCVTESVSDYSRGELINVEGPKGFILFLPRGLGVNKVAIGIDVVRHEYEDIICLK